MVDVNAALAECIDELTQWISAIIVNIKNQGTSAIYYFLLYEAEIIWLIFPDKCRKHFL